LEFKKLLDFHLFFSIFLRTFEAPKMTT